MNWQITTNQDETRHDNICMYCFDSVTSFHYTNTNAQQYNIILVILLWMFLLFLHINRSTLMEINNFEGKFTSLWVIQWKPSKKREKETEKCFHFRNYLWPWIFFTDYEIETKFDFNRWTVLLIRSTIMFIDKIHTSFSTRCPGMCTQCCLLINVSNQTVCIFIYIFSTRLHTWNFLGLWNSSIYCKWCL